MENSDNIPSLTKKLKHSNEKIRLSALYELEKAEQLPTSMVPNLIEILRNDPMAEVRGWAAFALGNAGEITPEIETALIEALQDGTFALEGGGGMAPMTVSDCSRFTLRNFGVSAVPGLLKALDNNNELVRSQAIFALQVISPENPELVSRWLREITGDDDYTRDVAKGILGTMAARGISKAVEGLKEMLGMPDSNICFDAAISLGLAGHFDQEVIEKLTEILRSQNYSRKHNEVKQILGTAGKPAVPYLMNLLDEDEGNVRQMAVQVLGSIGNDAKAAGPVLLEKLHDEKAVRRAAVKALRKVDPELAKQKGL